MSPSLDRLPPIVARAASGPVVLLASVLAAFVAGVLPTRAATPAVAAGQYRTVAVDESGLAWQWGHDTVSPGYPDGLCDCSPPEAVPGAGGLGQLGDIVAVAASSHLLALGSDGTVWAWGENSSGQLGNGAANSGNETPTRVLGPGGVGVLSSVVAISAGTFHSLALRSDGSVWAWGAGSQGELGHGAAPGAPVTSPVRVVGIGGAGFLSGATAIDAGFAQSEAIVGGSLYTWGRDFSGQRGGLSSNFPVAAMTSPGGPALSGVAAVSAGDNFALALMTDGTVRSWGAGSQGQLGNGRQQGDGLMGSVHHFFPAPVKSPDGLGVLSGITRVSAGSEHGLALGAGGAAFAWGDGSTGFFLLPTNALGIGTSAPPDGPYQSLPIAVHGVGGPGTLTGLADLVASTGVSPWSAAVTPAGTILAWGANYYGELGFVDEDFGFIRPGYHNSTTVPKEICGFRLRPLAPTLTCPPVLEHGETYEITWTPIAGASGYLLQVGENAAIETAATSYEHHEPGDECLGGGLAHTTTFAVAAVVATTCDPVFASCIVPRASPFTEPPVAPIPACPPPVYTGDDAVFDWPDDGAAVSFEVDTNGDTVPDSSGAASTATVSGLAVGLHPLTVRGLSPCGAGEWSEPCSVRVRPDTSQCFTMAGIQVCSDAIVEDPPGTFTAESSFIRLSLEGDSDSDFALWVDGAVQGLPADDELAFDGTAYVDTERGRLDIMDNADAYEAPLTGGGGAAPAGGRRFCRMPRNPLQVPGVFACGVRNLLAGIPCATENPAGTFRVGCLPFNGQVTFWWNTNIFDFPNLPNLGCVIVQGSFGMEDVPENPGFFADGTVALCPLGDHVRGRLNEAEVRLAGCLAQVTGGTLTNQTPGDTTTPFGALFDDGELRCPQLGNLRTTVDDLFVAPSTLSVAGAHLSVSELNTGLVNVRSFEGDLLRRNPASLGYRICGDGTLGFPLFFTDLDAGITLLDGDLQQVCVNPKVLREVARIIPRFPVMLDKLGGCYTAFDPASGNDAPCHHSPDFSYSVECLQSCVDPPFVQLHGSLRAGLPGPWGDGEIASIAPAGFQFADGARLGGTLKLLGHRVGNAEICLSPEEAGMCAAVTLGIVSGDANLGFDKRGLAGRVRAEVDLPRFEFLGVGHDPPPFSVTAYVGPYRDDPPFANPRDLYGFVVGFDLAGPRLVGIDVRTLSLSLTGVETLAPFSPLVGGAGGGGGVAGAVGASSFIVPAGSAQAIFSATSSQGVPVLTLLPPGGGELTEGSPGTHALADEDSALLAVDDPEAGEWTVQVTGVPEAATVTTSAVTEPATASIDVTSPSGDGASLHVAWAADVPSAEPATTLRLVASQVEANAADGVGLALHEAVLAGGAGSFDIPEGVLAAGTWFVAAALDDGLGHVSVDLAPGTITVVDVTGPVPPAGAEATALFDGARVTWNASPSPDVSRYEVLVTEADDDPANVVVLPAGLALKLDIHGQVGTSDRLYRVRGVDHSGNVGESVEAGVVAADPSADGTPPATPTGLAAVAQGFTGVHLSWNGPGDADAFRVRYGLDARGLGREAGQGESPVEDEASPLDLTGFNRGQHVVLSVAAVDAAGNESERSSTVRVFLTDGLSSDGDGLPDDWELLYFGSLTASDGTGDADHDLLTDAEELGLAQDPLAFDAFTWGDVSPIGAPDDDVNIADVVRALNLTLTDMVSPEELRRGNVAPAVYGEGELLVPTLAPPRRITVGDVVLLLRSAVGLSTLANPEDALSP